MGKALFIVLLIAALPFSILTGPSSIPLFPVAVPSYAQPASNQPSKAPISLTGGPGDTPETAVVIIGAANSMAGVAAEYHYLERQFGRRQVDWRLKRQSVRRFQGKIYDAMEIELADGSRKTIFFDISEFFGKL